MPELPCAFAASEASEPGSWQRVARRDALTRLLSRARATRTSHHALALERVVHGALDEQRGEMLRGFVERCVGLFQTLDLAAFERGFDFAHPLRDRRFLRIAELVAGERECFADGRQ